MPHKRAKRSVREQRRSDSKTDRPPSGDLPGRDDTPKAMMRVLNAQKVREAFKDRKRKGEGEHNADGKRKKQKTSGQSEAVDKKKSAVKIQPGESLGHFNIRVEDDMRSSVQSAIRSSTSTSKTQSKKAAQEASQAKKDTPSSKNTKNTELDVEHEKPRKSSPPPDFRSLSSSAPKRLNDIAERPPELSHVMKKRVKKDALSKANNGVVSMAQKRMMELEREKAIERYRALRDKKTQAFVASVEEKDVVKA